MKKSQTGYWKKYWAEHKERRREIRRKSEARPDYKERKKKYMKEWAVRNKDKIRANRKKWEAHHKTRQITKDAVASGKLIKLPCKVCGSTKVEAHHLDYKKPYLIQWLCREHHIVHRRLS